VFIAFPAPAVNLTQEGQRAPAAAGGGVKTDVGGHQRGLVSIKPVDQPQQVAQRRRRFL
jgi:hypothetical protein